MTTGTHVYVAPGNVNKGRVSSISVTKAEADIIIMCIIDVYKLNQWYVRNLEKILVLFILRLNL